MHPFLPPLPYARCNIPGNKVLPPMMIKTTQDYGYTMHHTYIIIHNYNRITVERTNPTYGSKTTFRTFPSTPRTLPGFSRTHVSTTAELSAKASVSRHCLSRG